MPRVDAPRQSPRRLCVTGLIFCWILGCAILGIGVFSYRLGQRIVPLTQLSRGLILLGINTFVTLLNENLGDIHTISLKWSLQREGSHHSSRELQVWVCSSVSLLQVRSI